MRPGGAKGYGRPLPCKSGAWHGLPGERGRLCLLLVSFGKPAPSSLNLCDQKANGPQARRGTGRLGGDPIYYFFLNPRLPKVSLPPSQLLPAALEMPWGWLMCRGQRGAGALAKAGEIWRRELGAAGQAFAPMLLARGRTLLLSRGMHDGRQRELEPCPSRSLEKGVLASGARGALLPWAPNGLMSVCDGCRKPGSGAGRGLGPGRAAASLPGSVGRTGAASAES